jgi:hypothetical protein
VPKPPKQTVPYVPHVGERCKRPGSASICEVDYVSKDGREVNIRLKGINLQWFRVAVSKLIWIDRK